MIKTHRLFFYINLLAVISLSSYAQEISYDLKNCIDYALQHHMEIRNSKLSENLEKQRFKETRSLLLPQISGSVNYQYNFQIPIAVIGDRVIRMGTKHQLIPLLEASQVVYNPAHHGNFLLGRLEQQLAQYNTKRSEIDVISSVTKAYYGILVIQEQLKLLESNIERLKKSLNAAQLQYDNGLAQKVDVSRIQLMLNSALTEKGNALRSERVQKQLLKFQMGMPLKKPLTLSGVFTQEALKEISEPFSTNDFYKDRIEYLLAEKQKQIASVQLRNSYRAYLPSVSVFGSYRLFLQGEHFEKLFSMGYHPNSLVGVKIDLPIFSGLKKIHQLERTKIQEQIAQNTIDYLQESMQYELEKSQEAFQNAIDNLKTQKDNRELAETNYKNLKYQYENGVRPNIEVLSAQVALKEAENAYINALYEIMMTKVDLEKALGKIKTR